jgi:hypothetical protein
LWAARSEGSTILTPSVIAGRQSRQPKDTGQRVAVPRTATAGIVFMGGRDERPAMTVIGGDLLAENISTA